MCRQKTSKNILYNVKNVLNINAKTTNNMILGW